VLTAAFNQPLQEMSLENHCRLIMLGFAVVLALVIWQAPEGVGAATAVYLVTYGVFHFGMLLIVAIYPGFEDLFIVQRHKYWLYADTGRYAANLALMGACAYGAATGLMKVLWPATKRSPSKNVHPKVRQVFLYAGLALTVGFIGIFYMQIIQWGVVGATYREYREARSEMSTINTYSGIAMGVIFLLAAGPSRWQRIGLGLFLLGWSPLAFVMGLRGEVLFPLATAFMLYARRLSKKIPFVRIALLAFVLLMLVSAARVVRHIGVQQVLDVDREVPFDPLSGLGELGGSLAPLHASISWIRDGDPYLWGAGYTAGIDRQFVPLLVPSHSPPPLGRDPRIPAYSKKNVPGSGFHRFGFSMTATAYYNFGPIGVVAVMFIAGCIISALGYLPVSPYYQALCGAIFYPLVVHVRSFFMNVPKRMILAVLLVFITNVTAHIMARRSDSRHQNEEEPAKGSSE
jgi:oligosaccharide repeat unit polymerase